jgi:hypothetical protein
MSSSGSSARVGSSAGSGHSPSGKEANENGPKKVKYKTLSGGQTNRRSWAAAS